MARISEYVEAADPGHPLRIQVRGPFPIGSNESDVPRILYSGVARIQLTAITTGEATPYGQPIVALGVNGTARASADPAPGGDDDGGAGEAGEFIVGLTVTADYALKLASRLIECARFAMQDPNGPAGSYQLGVGRYS